MTETAAASLSGRSLIEIDGLGKVYESRRGEVPALESIDLRVESGEFVGVVGPSGCGKSTLLKVLLGVIAPSTGDVYVDGDRVTEPRTDIGMMFQSPVLLPWRSVLSNVLLPIEILRLDRRSFVDRARTLLEMVGLEDFEQHYPRELSGGMQQRVAMCRALIHDPRILLLDEPFGALDSITREELNDDLQRIWAETRKTVILVTHNIDEAVYLADRVAVISARPGHVLEELAIDLGRPRTLETRAMREFDELTLEIRRLLGLARSSGPADDEGPPEQGARSSGMDSLPRTGSRARG